MGKLVGSFILDLEEVPFICHGDKAFFTLTGYDQNQLMQQGAARQVLANLDSILNELNEAGQVASQLLLRCSSGEIKPVYAFATSSRHPETGRLICVFMLGPLPEEGEEQTLKSRVGICRWQREDGKLLEISPNMLRIFDIKAEGAPGLQNIAQLPIHPSDFPALLAAPWGIEEGERIEHTFRIIRQTGSIACLMGELRVDQGVVTGMAMDITVAVIHGQRDLIEAIPSLYFAYMEGQNKLYFANQLTYELLQVKQENADQFNFHEIIHPDDREALMQAASNGKAGEKAPLCEFRMQLPDGKLVWLQGAVQSRMIGTDRLITVIANEITGIKRAEAELERSHQTLKNITSNVDCAILRLSYGEHGLQRLYSNDQFAQMLGYTQGELERMDEGDFLSCIHPDDRARLCAHILYDKVSEGVEARFFTKAGTTFWATIRSRWVNEGEGEQYILCTFQNIDHLKRIQQELTINNNRYRVLLRNLADQYFEVDLRNNVLYRAPPWGKKYFVQEITVGVPEAFITSGFFQPDDYTTIRDAYAAIKQGKPQVVVEVQRRLPSGALSWVEVTMFNTFDSNDQPIRALGLLKDITRQKEQELRFAGEEQYLKSMIKTSVAVITFSLHDERLITYYYNGKESQIQPKDKSLRTSMHLIAHTKVHPEDRVKMLDFYAPGRIALTWGKGSALKEQIDFRMRRDEGGPYIWVRSTMTMLQDPVGEGLICFSYIHDINSQKEIELALLKRAESDPLTGILNREAMRTRINAFLCDEAQSAKIHALIYLDLDGFKQVNDKYGHRVGDSVLVELAEKLRSSVRAYDFVARLGGDEYAIFLKNADDINIIVQKAKQLCSLALSLHVADHDEGAVSMSMGVALAPNHGMDFDTLYNYADKAMYIAKGMGKNRVAIYEAEELGLEPDALSIPTADIDWLTGYGNYERFARNVEQQISGVGREHYGLVCYNVKHFSAINDQLGYEGGNRVLKQLAGFFNSFCREGELFARMWGDQFVALCRYTQAEELVRRFYLSAERGFGVEREEGNWLSLKMSAGVYPIEKREDIASISQMLDRASIAQKTVESLPGSNIVFYSSQMRDQIIFEQEIEKDMVNALKNSELEVYYQPRIDIICGNNLSGLEALVRWQHPQKGLLTPTQFIGVFERSGFIAQVDEFVFQRVCGLLRHQLSQGKGCVPISVNISGMSLYAPGFVRRYTAIRDEYEIPAGMIEMEFAESIVSNHVGVLSQIVRDLKKVGFSCSVDDVGASVTTMSLLRDLSVDNIKIDRALLEACPGEERRGETVLSSLIQLAQRLGMRIVTEGVEHIDQVEALRDMGCDYVQGYLYAHPLPWESIDYEITEGAHSIAPVVIS